MLKRFMLQILTILSLTILVSGQSASLPHLASGKRVELIHQLPTTLYQTSHTSGKSDGKFSDTFDLEFIMFLAGPTLVRSVVIPASIPLVLNLSFATYCSSGPSPPAIS